MLVRTFQRLGEGLSRVAARVVPDPFVLALGLTLLVMAVGGGYLLSQGTGVGLASRVVVESWLAGFGNPGGLAFALQMCLVLVTGHAVATSPMVQQAVAWVAGVPRSSASAAALVAFVSCLAAVVHWGLGAIVGAFVAREMARAAESQGRTFHYPLLGAAAYAGLAVWHGGLSGSAPLKVAEEGHFLADVTGVVPMDQTVFSGANLVITGTLIVVITGLFWLMAPGPSSPVGSAGIPSRVGGEGAPPSSPPRPGGDVREAGRGGGGGEGAIHRLQDSPWVGTTLGLAGLLMVGLALGFDLATLDINTVNMGFLFVGMTLQGSLSRYIDAIGEGARGVGGVVIQFPFYFAILGVMGGTGLIALASDGLAALATETTFPIIAFVSAGLVNLFVPSGGGQWAVQGKILTTTGASLGVEPEVTVMAFAYGDAWTNMLQPFWALPLLGIMGLRARDIMGYAALVFVVMGLVVPLLLLAVY